MNRDLGNERREYNLSKLSEDLLPADPIVLFSEWLQEALDSPNPDPTAMTLSTVERSGQPSSRIVLLKKVEQGKLIFYTNYHSRKAREIRIRVKVAAHFFWPEIERQVNITGNARPVTDSDSETYFASRPYESRIAAWASPQSEVVPNREYLEKEFEKYQKRYKSAEEVPRPAYWGGYAISPLRMEFWQGGEKRLHDRIEYLKKDERWSHRRLAP